LAVSPSGFEILVVGSAARILGFGRGLQRD
jgi:hypothetical protein